MNDFGFLYYRDKDTGEYKILGKVNSLIVKGIRNVEATTIREEPSKIIDTTAREIGKGDLEEEEPIRASDKHRGLRASANCIDDFPFLEEEENG